MKLVGRKFESLWVHKVNCVIGEDDERLFSVEGISLIFDLVDSNGLTKTYDVWSGALKESKWQPVPVSN